VPLWKWWIVVVFVLSAPWIGFDIHPHWERIHLVPFSDPADRPHDIVSNLLLFVPFGWSYAGRKRGMSGVLQGAVLGIAVSVGAEATQLFSTLRYPSATDVLMALTGTLAGDAAAALWNLRPLP
jgi:glycopeptide antibiotics resistance protein